MKSKILPYLCLALALTSLRPPALDGQGAGDRAAVSEVLDTLHEAASEADFERYFGLYAEDAIFLGTDATERWTLDGFKDYARVRFEQGQGWTYTPIERHVYVAPDGTTAWFDERLDNASLGETRGTGALVKRDGLWRIAQYNLTIPIPNELARDVVGQIRATTSSSGAPSDDPPAFRDEFMGHFERGSFKITELARVMPQELYEWSPGEGVMEVGEVYMHLARYNFMYLDENLGIAPPDGLDYSGIESIRDKERVRELFALSVRHVTDQVMRMTETDLSRETRLYGRTVDGAAVLFQLISHMNEHVGQSVAYARMNGIAPPWSR